MTSEYIPTAIEREGETGLRISWSDGSNKHYSADRLRKACPCATCREKHGTPEAKPQGLPVLSIAEARPVAIERMRPVGNYAYNIAFSDGHDSGIFTFDHLFELGADE